MHELHFSERCPFSLQSIMPFNCLGLLVGDTDADNAVGPVPIVNNALLTESRAFLQTEDGSYLEFEF